MKDYVFSPRKNVQTDINTPNILACEYLVEMKIDVNC